MSHITAQRLADKLVGTGRVMDEIHMLKQTGREACLTYSESGSEID